MTLLATLFGVAAGAIAVAGYHKAAVLQEEIHRPKAPPPEKPTDDLEDQVRRLEARVALLELHARTAPREGETTSAAAAPPSPRPASPAAPPAPTAQRPDDVTPPPKDPQQRQERQQRITATVETYWKEWGVRNGLTPAQTDALSAIQAEAARRKLDNQAKMIDHQITQADARADNQAATEDVRRKARTLLTPGQYSQFEADKGAEWGSSYRRVREAHARAAAPPP